VFSKLQLAGGIVGVVMAAALFMMWRANGKLHEEVGSLELSLAQAVATNRSNVVVIDDLVIRNNQCVEDRRVDEERSRSTVMALNQDLERLRARPTIVREEVYRDPSCAQLGAIDIAAACPVLASSVRERARGLNGSPDP
jgi:hypothetical protein